MHELTDQELQGLTLLFQHLPFDDRTTGASHSDLTSVLSEALQRCRRAYPSVEVDLAGFAKHLASKTLGEEPVAALTSRHVEDLFLAYACASGIPSALAAFGVAYTQDVDVACAKVGGVLAADEVRQQLFHKLFVAQAPSIPRILEYSGQGTLRGWFRVVTGRLILDHLRASTREGYQVSEDVVLGVPSPGDDPEMEYLKTQYRHEFRDSFEAAVGSLQPEERNVLRSYYAKGMSIDDIAIMFGIHRATAARRVNRARDALMTETRRRLTRRLMLSGNELESVLRLIESNLHVSVERLMR